MLYGLTLPPFMFSFSKILLKTRYIRELLLKCGKYSFQIYLFQWPLILPFISRLILNILNINYLCIPYLVTILTIITCIYTYNLTKKIKFNTLFE